MAGAGARWIDAQPFLERVCGQLALGQLLHGTDFSLAEAMSAIEIGDPKMDQGLGGAAANLDALLEAHAPLHLPAPQLLGVLDRLLAVEAGWHNGGTVVQSLFTCLYLHKPQRVADSCPPLYAYCCGVLATSVLVRDLHLKGCTCEDEDYMPHPFGLSIDVPGCSEPGGAAAALRLAVELVEGRQRQAAVADVAAAAQLDPQLCAPLCARLRLRRALMQGLQQLLSMSSGADLEAARKLFAAAADSLAAVRSSVELAAGGGEGGGEGCGCVGFEPGIHGKLSIPLPPRPLKVYSVAEALDYTAQLLDDLQFVCASLPLVGASWDALTATLAAFRGRAPAAIARSAMHFAVCRCHHLAAREPPPWAPSAAMVYGASGLPPLDGPAGAALDAAPEARDFVAQCVIGLENWVQVQCLNPPRRFRRIKRLLEDWANLYSHALNTDVSPEAQQLLRAAGWAWVPLDEAGDDIQGPLGSWVEEQTAATMLQRLMEGLELELYAPHEFAMIYWYADYLIGVMQSNAKHIFRCQPKPALPKAPSGSGRRAAAAAGAAQQEALARSNRHMTQVLGLEAQRMACQALMRACVGMAVGGKLRAGPYAFNATQQHFEQRFGPFNLLMRPEPLTCAHYATSMDTTGVDAATLYKLARDCLGKARSTIALLQQHGQRLHLQPASQVSYYNALDRVCMQNSVALSVLLRGVEGASGDDALAVSWDYSHHPHFPVMKVKSASAARNGGKR